MTTTQHQVTVRFVTDDAEDTPGLARALEDGLVELTADLDEAGAMRVTTRYETRRNGYGQASSHPADADPDEGDDEA